MDTRLAPGIRVEVFEGELKECQKKVNEWFMSPGSKTRRILDISVADHAILVTFEVR